ncbi:MAG: patatin-like phospholipase family protein [Desulfotomaculum sp.]|nr:patatin-like phospholipase family protein [Desulfotomaculum sp.]
MQQKKKIGLALGGGFLRGAAHIGVLKVLEREKLEPDIIAGTSAGSIIAALYAAGWNTKKIEKLALSLKFKDVYDTWSALLNLLLIMGDMLGNFLKFSWPCKPPLGLMKGKNLEKFLAHQLRDSEFTNLKMTLAITAVDINCGSKVIFLRETLRAVGGPDEVYLYNIPVADAVRASTAVPGLFEPKEIKGYQLTDGGLREQVPAEVLYKMGADAILAVDVGYDGDSCTRVNSIAHLLMQTLDIIRHDAISRELKQYADLVIAPLIKDMGPLDFHRIPYAISQGEAAAREMLPEIKKLFQQ